MQGGDERQAACRFMAQFSVFDAEISKDQVGQELNLGVTMRHERSRTNSKTIDLGVSHPF